ncbi:MAG TPA: Xaa-Pro peptidase family protein [Methanocorpusculum sp.]|nr:Xaa-Pro peptidase family protein [Methanocorpusculum sp.]
MNDGNYDAYVSYDSSNNSNMRYLTNFTASDPYVYILSRTGVGTIIVPTMEYTRACKQSTCNVLTRNEAGYLDLFKKYKDPELALAHLMKKIGGNKLLIPSSMPVGFANILSSVAEIGIDKNSVTSMRSIKTENELNKIREVQRKTEIATQHAIDFIRDSKIDTNGGLIMDDVPVTSESIRELISLKLRSLNCEDHDTIVSCGIDTSMPHCIGEGQLKSNQPIVLDVFPRDLTTGYFADMTRTISKGTPSQKIIDMYETVRNAKSLAIDMIQPGISGSDVHNAVTEYFESKGYHTSGLSGFIHGLGHGVGLDIHESPSLSQSGDILKPGNVITIEPGLYYPGIGGIRLEDMGVVTNNGFDKFTNYNEILIV